MNGQNGYTFHLFKQTKMSTDQIEQEKNSRNFNRKFHWILLKTSDKTKTNSVNFFVNYSHNIFCIYWLQCCRSSFFVFQRKPRKTEKSRKKYISANIRSQFSFNWPHTPVLLLFRFVTSLSVSAKNKTTCNSMIKFGQRGSLCGFASAEEKIYWENIIITCVNMMCYYYLNGKIKCSKRGIKLRVIKS